MAFFYKTAAMAIVIYAATFFGISAAQQTNVRLVGGSYPSEGRLEVFLNGAWGTSYYDTFDITDAGVVCRSLGYGGAAYEECCSIYGQGTGPIHMENVQCSGSESSILDCSYTRAASSRSHIYDQSVRCQDMRLVGGSSWSGRLEVFLNGAWGTVCGDDWDLDDAHVVCRSMGFGDASEATTGATFGQGTVDIALDNVQCNGSERSIFECPHNGHGIHDCSHSDDAGVRCSGNYALQEDETVTIAKHNLWRSNQHSVYTGVWTFTSSINSKILFHFLESYYVNSQTSYYVKIGDGLTSGQSQRLHHYFHPTNRPGDVTSTSNNAWMLMYHTGRIFSNRRTLGVIMHKWE